MRRYILLLFGLALLVSCENGETLSNPRLCDNEYFYYSGGSKIYLKHSLSEIWIEFKQNEVTSEKAESVLKNYSFIVADLTSAINYNRIKVKINKKCDCTDFKTYLKELNQDIEILSATPVFYTSYNEPDSYLILLSEVLTKNNENIISEPDFINYAETINLELIESKYSTQHFKVKEVKTGFESLEIANQIYESGKVEYSHPNFIAKIAHSF